MKKSSIFLTGEIAELETLEEEILGHLQEKKATFQKLRKELKVEKSDEEFLAFVLKSLERDEQIKSKSLNFPVSGGFLFTTMFETVQKAEK